MINNTLDKRIKIPRSHYDTIRKRYRENGESQRQIASAYGVSCRLIQFILFPERLERAKKQLKERAKDGRYYNTQKNTEAMRKYRQRKKELKNISN